MRNSSIVIGCFLLMVGFTAMAEDMACGEYIISDDETNAQTMSDIKQKCGEPQEMHGSDWYYQKEEGLTYTLHFNDDGQLESIDSGSAE